MSENQNCINRIKGRILSILFTGPLIKYKVLAFKDKIINIERQNTLGTEIKKEGEEIFLKIPQYFCIFQA